MLIISSFFHIFHFKNPVQGRVRQTLGNKTNMSRQASSFGANFEIKDSIVNGFV